MKEIWKDIPGYEGRYFISNQGRVRGPLKILKPSITNWGYERVRITDNLGKKNTPSIHRLVAQAFIPNPKNKPEVNHIDGDKRNNAASNLEWTTAKENKQHSIRELDVAPWGMHKKPIKCKENGKTYYSIAYASAATGISKTQLAAHLKGERSHAGGFHWEYIKK